MSRLAFIAFGLLPAIAVAAPQPVFDSPDAAARALHGALLSRNTEELRNLLGDELLSKFSSGDPVLDSLSQEQLAYLLSEERNITSGDDGVAVVAIGRDRWPFPVPLTAEAGEQGSTQWRFNRKLGEREVADRRIGANEIRALRVTQHFIDAQRLYAGKDRDGDGHPEYARRFRSTPGKFDGLYWELTENAPASPLAPSVGRALVEAEGSQGGNALYHGYRFKILRQQGKNAPGGEKPYFDQYGRMSQGVAILAYPSRYGVSGIISFISGIDGTVYERDLGPDTSRIAGNMSAFDPDQKWRPLSEDGLGGPSSALKSLP